jgi:hypothetical protein
MVMDMSSVPIPTKLVLIDGIPGSGKSTTAHLLAIQAARCGIPVQWFYEDQEPHPVNIWNVDEPNMLARESLERWQTFAQQASQDSTLTILESTVFQSTIRLLFEQDMPLPKIRRYFNKVTQAILPLQPVLIYFRHPDLATAIHNIVQERGPTWQRSITWRLTHIPYSQHRGYRDYDGAVQFLRDYRVVCDDLIPSIPFRSLTIEDATNNRLVALSRIRAFLGLPPYQPDIPPPEALQVWTGAYRDKLGDLSCVIRLTDAGLEGNNLWWPFPEIFTPLLPKDETGTRFSVRGTPLEVRFTQDAEGQVELHVGGAWGAHMGKMLIKQHEHASG